MYDDLLATIRTERDAHEFVHSIDASDGLDGVQGEPPAAVGALIDPLLAGADLVVENPAIAGFALNPVRVTSERTEVLNVAGRLNRTVLNGHP